ncbi:sulfotransferase family 2 domain-containing protein [Erythrobacter rubeus]|uniref:Sulfotransferase family 2 domain-containing protein n=1 Tax=Erythrobacter rubeus TaxID=2760803 RepID=A0ABR8KKW5_9SPHN|nr:sulfotransferase family 2 domain-containing protein [Erythrobacter rubeus]MBD2840968.1 sulfotransferase family 2 domain-containing protein [Erythrobacter rubeus]
MFFDHPKSLIFVHNPKTGGRSIIKFLGLDDSEPFRFAHAPSELIRKKFFQSDWDKFFSFAFVRNPWERYASLYRFQRSPAYAAMMGNNFSAVIAARFDLNEWVEFNARSETKSNWFGMDQQLWWRGVSKVYRFDQLAEAREALANRFGTTGALPHENSTPSHRGMGSADFTDRSMSIIADLDRATIEEFGFVPD